MGRWRCACVPEGETTAAAGLPLFVFHFFARRPFPGRFFSVSYCAVLGTRHFQGLGKTAAGCKQCGYRPYRQLARRNGHDSPEMSHRRQLVQQGILSGTACAMVPVGWWLSRPWQRDSFWSRMPPCEQTTPFGWARVQLKSEAERPPVCIVAFSGTGTGRSLLSEAEVKRSSRHSEAQARTSRAAARSMVLTNPRSPTVESLVVVSAAPQL